MVMKTVWLFELFILCLIKVTTQATSLNSTCDLFKQFDCGTECIPKSWQCDNMKDCPNGADEMDCEPSYCPEGQMLCEHGGCVPGAYKCDGHDDCYDKSDEKYCGHISYSLSENPSFNFGDPNHYKNDGGYDKNGCLPGFGLCGIQQLCIPNRSFCDGKEDCFKESDERNCTSGGTDENSWPSTISRNPCQNKFVCEKKHFWDDQKCINQEELCNGKKDCPLGDDETEKCNECSTKNCKYQCRNTPTGAECECYKGYRLDSDDVTCVDIDECTLPKRACDHFCENTIGSFRCSCAEGYHLKAEEKTCELTNPSEGFLLLQHGNEIKIRPLEDFTETNFTTFYKYPKKGYIRSFDYSRRDDKLFIATYEELESDQLVMVQNGTSRILRENVFNNNYYHIAFDWIGSNLFYAEKIGYKNGDEYSLYEMISVCTMDGRFYRRLIEIEEDHRVQGLIIHPTRGLLFWYDYPNSITPTNSKKQFPYRIMMANMDGSQIQPLVENEHQITTAFAIDYVNHDIYYEDKSSFRIRRVNIDTRKTEVIASTFRFGGLQSMGYHSGFLYWTNWQRNLRVREVSRKEARVHRIFEHNSDFFTLGASPRMIANDSLHQLEPSAGNPCKELDCPWICVIVPDFTAKCLCPDGYTPSILGTTCIPPLPETGEHDNLIGLELMSEYCKAGVGCLNEGSCREVSNKTRTVCDCVEPYDGLYCERRKPMVSDEAILIIIPVVLFLLLLVVVCCGVYWCFFSQRENKTDAVTDTLPSYGRFENNESTL